VARCRTCDDGIGSKCEIRYEAVEYPYNPEWQIIRTDAAVFCSDGCLLRYIAEKIDAPDSGSSRTQP